MYFWILEEKSINQLSKMGSTIMSKMKEYKFFDFIVENRFMISIVVSMLLVGFVDYYYAYYSLIVLGERPVVGISGALLFMMLYILGISLFDKLLKNKLGRKIDLMSILLCLVFPIVSIVMYCDFYSLYVAHLEQKFLEKSNISIGEIYAVKKGSGRSPSYKIKVGVDKEHIRKNKVFTEDSEMINYIQKGDKVILRVSDEYPRVNEIIEWEVTSDNIKKYFHSNEN